MDHQITKAIQDYLVPGKMASEQDSRVYCHMHRGMQGPSNVPPSLCVALITWGHTEHWWEIMLQTSRAGLANMVPACTR